MMKEYQKIEKQNLLDELKWEKQKSDVTLIFNFLICILSVAFVTYVVFLACALVILGPIHLLKGLFAWIF